MGLCLACCAHDAAIAADKLPSVPSNLDFEEGAKYWRVPKPKWRVVDLGTADLLLLDSLNENPKGEGSNNAVAGTLDDGQAKFLKEWAASAKRPFFVGAHHPPEEVPVDGRNLLAKFETNRCFAGYIHGHNHRWYLR